MYKDERDIYFYDIRSLAWNRKYGKGLEPFAHYELAKAIKAMYDADKAEKLKKSTGQSLYVTQIRLYDNRCEMLVGFSDPVAADPTLNDRPARKRRVIVKVDGEGIEHSAHILWHYKHKNNCESCSFYLEGAIGLRSTTVTQFFNKMLREFAKNNKYFEVSDPEGTVDPDGNFKKVPVRPGVELIGHPSEDFIRDLKKGELSEVELYTEKEKLKPWDSNGYSLEEHRSVILKPNKKKHVPKAKPLLDGVLTKKRKLQYEYARVKFKTDAGVDRNVRVFSENYNLLHDFTYVKKDRIDGLGGSLPNAFDKIYMIIMKKMRSLAGIS